jgi:hypothetical protein
MSAVLWNIGPHVSERTRCFGETLSLTPAFPGFFLAHYLTPKMEAICPSETSGCPRNTRHLNPKSVPFEVTGERNSDSADALLSCGLLERHSDWSMDWMKGEPRVDSWQKQGVQIGCGAKPVFYPLCTGHSSLWRICGAVPQFLHVSSCRDA